MLKNIKMLRKRTIKSPKSKQILPKGSWQLIRCSKKKRRKLLKKRRRIKTLVVILSNKLKTLLPKLIH